MLVEYGHANARVLYEHILVESAILGRKVQTMSRRRQVERLTKVD